MISRSLVMHSVRATLLALGAAVALLGSAAAADKTKPAPAPAPKKDAILTPEQLRDCVAQEQRKTKATDAALKAKAEIAADKAEIDRSGTALAQESGTLDRTSEDAVDAFNAKVDERNKRIEAYEAKVAAYNKDTEAIQTMDEAYNKSCANRRYDDRDLADIQRKK
jgi:hypothetical protein